MLLTRFFLINLGPLRPLLLLLCCLHIGVVQAQQSGGPGISGGKANGPFCKKSYKNLSNRLQDLCHLMETSAQTLMSEKFNRNCNNFISPDGKLGEWGLLVLDAIEEIDPSCFYERMNVEKLCPKYSSLGLADKAKFWVWVFASISQVESSCRQKIRAMGVNGLADGLMQLEYSYLLRRASGRDSKLCRTKGPTDSSAVVFQFNCAASIFRDVHCAYNRPLSYRGGYWEKLRGGNRKISRLVRGFSKCR